MKQLVVPVDANVIVGMDTSDDAGVYRLTDEIALIQTLDFITPIVDDPFVYGQIAVTNGLSDIYAMGGRPLTALNIVCFPVSTFSLDTLARVLQGGLSVLDTAGVQLLGGHSVDDPEFKYGVSVTGIVHPDRVLTNTGVRPGDAIVLSKALGTGIVNTAVKAGMADPAHAASAIRSMTLLNRDAAACLEGRTVHACTDVTGFGLMGHLKEMIGNDPVAVHIDAKAVPLIPGAAEYASNGLIPAGMYRNRDHVGALCTIDPSVPREVADIVFDPQTSGGLLVSLPAAEAEALCAALRARGCPDARIIGSVRESERPAIAITP